MIEINSLNIGPIVGHVDTNHARVFGGATYECLANGEPRRAFGIARIKKIGGSYRRPIFFKMSPNFDMTGLAIFQDLSSDESYDYQMGWFYSDKELDELSADQSWDWKACDSGRFKTATENSNEQINFVFGSCRYLLKLFGGNWFDNRGDKTFRSILRQMENGAQLNKLLMVGDQIYADDLKFIGADSNKDEFCERYREAFSQPHISQLMANIPTYMTLDDHEIEDNWPKHATEKDHLTKYPHAIRAYEIYQLSHSPLLPHNNKGKFIASPDRYFYSFSDGCCDFFVTDTRTERDYDEGEIIGEEQMDELLAWLNDGSGKVKLIASAVPFFPDTKKANDDKWSAFKQQRDQIIEHIQLNHIEKVVFLSGDVHCSMSAELDISVEGQPPLKILSIISSSFFWPYPHMKRRQFKVSGYVASEANPNAYPITKVTKGFSGDNFTRVKVTPSRLVVEIFARKGGLVSFESFDI
ncbi:alkaline phosphatase D family protein [Vibrio sp. DNB22_10_4]